MNHQLRPPINIFGPEVHPSWCFTQLPTIPELPFCRTCQPDVVSAKLIDSGTGLRLPVRGRRIRPPRLGRGRQFVCGGEVGGLWCRCVHVVPGSNSASREFVGWLSSGIIISAKSCH
jgi:hypothetical protein